MKTIVKYEMSATEPLVIRGGARLTVRFVDGDLITGRTAPSVWVEIDDDPEVPEEELILTFVDTGQPVPEGVHVGSCKALGTNVWHVFSTRKSYG